MKTFVFLLSFFCINISFNDFINQTNQVNGKKIALLVSVEDTIVPDYDSSDTQNGNRYRDNIEDLLYDNDFSSGNIKKLTNPTSDEFLIELENQIKSLNDDDFLVFYFYGHGGQVIDKNGDEKLDNENDIYDETLVMQNDEVLDDEIYSILLKYKTKAKILFIIECCNSGTPIKMLEENQLIHDEVLDKSLKPTFDIIYVGATIDGTSVPANLFNRVFIETFEDDEYDSYMDFFNELRKQMYKKGVLISVGLQMASQQFINQPPLK